MPTKTDASVLVDTIETLKTIAILALMSNKSLCLQSPLVKLASATNPDISFGVLSIANASAKAITTIGTTMVGSKGAILAVVMESSQRTAHHRTESANATKRIISYGVWLYQNAPAKLTTIWTGFQDNAKAAAMEVRTGAVPASQSSTSK